MKDKDKDMPFDLLRCTTPKCSGQMHWKAEDIKAKKEILRCSHCNHSVDSDEVILTRVSLMKTRLTSCLPLPKCSIST